jgi:NADH dehydrogenase
VDESLIGNDERRMPGVNGRDRADALIIGGGFAGVNAARRLDRKLRRHDERSVVLISRDNFHLFTPLLAEVASSQIESRHAVNPLRRMLKRVRYIQGTVTRVETNGNRVSFVDENGRERELEYDQCVLACGSETAFFGIPGLAGNAFTLKRIGDAIAIRNHVVQLLERAQVLSEAERSGLLTFAVGGGGLNGTEVMGELHDFVMRAVRDYTSIDPGEIRMVLIEMLDHLAQELPEQLGAYAQRDLERRGVEVWLNSKIEKYESGLLKTADGREVRTDTVVWTAGVRPSTLIEQIPVEEDAEDQRLPTNEFLQVRGFDDLWAVGDCAMIRDSEDGSIHPPTAQHAVRQGRGVADNVWSALYDRELKPFSYKGRGMLASLGQHRGIGQVFGVRLAGFAAWFVWRSYYLMALPRWERRIRVAIDWTLDLIFKRDVIQLKVEPTKGSMSAAANDGEP